MKKMVWLTDLHLTVCENPQEKISKIAEVVHNNRASGCFMTGDTSQANSLIVSLAGIESVLKMPIYFVLGNHDYWGSTVENIRTEMKNLGSFSTFLKYLGNSSYLPLTDSTCVLGHDGWYDFVLGGPNIAMNDWKNIGDFNGLSNQGIVAKAQELSRMSALSVMNSIKAATRYYKNIIILTHVPPWKEISLDDDKFLQNEKIGSYTSKFMGDVISQAAKAFPNVTFTVLCGHSHFEATHQVSSNIIARCGKAKYGSPDVFGYIEII